jgi:hypothetical protein
VENGSRGAGGENGNPRTLGLGLRYYPVGRSRTHPQPYVEASPALYWLHHDSDVDSDRLLAGGLLGLVVPRRVVARVGFELGLFYLRSRSSDPDGRPFFPGMNHLSMRAGLWFGP